MLDLIRRYLGDESGATAVEYGMIVTVLTLTIIGGFQHASEALAFLFGDNASTLQQTFNR